MKKKYCPFRYEDGTPFLKYETLVANVSGLSFYQRSKRSRNYEINDGIFVPPFLSANIKNNYGFKDGKKCYW